MATSFDNAVPDLVATAEAVPGFSDVESAVAVRDVRGRVRLVIDPTESLDLEVLRQALSARLGPWFHGPVLSTLAASAAERRLAAEVLARGAGWPGAWPSAWTDATGATHPIPSRWRGYQRMLSKQAWLETSSSAPGWELRAGEPVIVAFYSFKGGVGRSTLLGVIAWQLARCGKKVVCVDLDVEAPGLGGLFGVEADSSVMEHLLAHAATGQLPAGDPVSWASLHGAEIGVVPAGRLGRGYLEKLARLDYLGTTSAQDSPVALGLRAVLERIRGQHSPDYVLLDCRAGLHDLGGLSLTDLAHVDVLVGRDTPQGREGLALTIDVLDVRRPPTARRILVAQTFVPLPLGGGTAQATVNRFRSAMYEACQATLYSELDDDPALEHDQDPHYSWSIGQYDEFAACQSLAEVSEGTLSIEAFSALRARLEALAAPEDGPAPPEEP